MSHLLLVKILTHPVASAMLCPSLLVERGEDRVDSVFGVSEFKIRHYIGLITYIGIGCTLNILLTPNPCKRSTELTPKSGLFPSLRVEGGVSEAHPPA